MAWPVPFLGARAYVNVLLGVFFAGKGLRVKARLKVGGKLVVLPARV